MRNPKLLIGILFIASGFAALIYQVTWFKYLSFFVGNTTYSQAIVLAAFMGGLAIGNYYFGKTVDKSSKPILLFAKLQIIIGIYAFSFPSFWQLLTDFLASFSSNNNISYEIIFAIKLITASILLLIPTTLMGGTLPILVKFLSSKLDDSAQNISALYTVNSLGAIFGALMAGFYFIPNWGLKESLYFAALIDLLIGVVSIITFYREKVKIIPPPKNSQKLDLFKIYTPRQRDIAIAIAGISGLTAFIYEVCWVRVFMPVWGSSTYSFSLMLVSVISGITLGSFFLSFIINKIKDLMMFLAICQLAIVISLVATLPLYGRIPYWFWQFAYYFTENNLSYNSFLLAQFLICFIVLLLPNIFLGMSLPIAARIAASGISSLGKAVGSAFSINTIGCVIGSLLTGLFLIPYIGTQKSIEIGLVLNLITGTIALFNVTNIKKSFIAFLIVPITLITFIYLFAGPEWNKLITLSEINRKIKENRPPPNSFVDYLDFIKTDNPNILYFKEGKSATVFITEHSKQISLIINGKTDASSVGDMPTQVMIGQIPMILHPKPESVLIVGLGSGTTAGSVLTHPVKNVKILEVSSEVVEASSFFNHVNNKPLEDPRVEMIIEDALSFIKFEQSTYDIIINQPSNPWISGIGNLFATEFFEIAKKKLNPGGILAQWFHVYEMDKNTLQLLLRTFSNSFKYVTLWQTLSSDILIIGTNDPQNIDYSMLKNKIAIPEVKKDLERIQIYNPFAFLSLYMFNQDNLKLYAGPGVLNSENNPLLEYWAPKAYFSKEKFLDFFALDEKNKGFNSFMNEYNLITPISSLELFQSSFIHMSRRGNTKWGQNVIKTLLESEIPDEILSDKYQLLYIINIFDKLGYKSKALELRSILVNSTTGTEEDSEVLNQRAIDLYQKGLYTESIQEYTKSIKLNAHQPILFNNRGLAHIQTQNYQKAIEDFTQAINLYELYGEAFCNRGNAYFELNNVSAALLDFDKAIEINPDFPPAYFSKGVILYKLGNTKEACALWQKAASLNFKQAEELIINYCRN
jgi:spermidine synthase